MRKAWMLIFLTPVIAFATISPMYEEQYEAEYDSEQNWDENMANQSYREDVQDDSFAYEEEAEEMYVAPPKRSRTKNSGDLSLNQNAKEKFKSPRSSQRTAGKRTAPRKNRSSVQDSYRSKMKDVRENSSRPRVTHRGQNQVSSNIQQMEADAQEENAGYSQNEAPSASQPLTEKKTGHIQRRPYLRKGIKNRSFRAHKREDVPRAHSGKRPLNH